MESKWKIFKKIVIVIFAVIFICIVTEKIFKYADMQRFKPVGKIVQVNGSKIHIYSKGSGKNTVVFTLCIMK